MRELPTVGGVREEEAVALLRLFYSQENQSAPVPQKRTRRQMELAGTAATIIGSSATLACLEAAGGTGGDSGVRAPGRTESSAVEDEGSVA